MLNHLIILMVLMLFQMRYMPLVDRNQLRVDMMVFLVLLLLMNMVFSMMLVRKMLLVHGYGMQLEETTRGKINIMLVILRQVLYLPLLLLLVSLVPPQAPRLLMSLMNQQYLMLVHLFLMKPL